MIFTVLGGVVNSQHLSYLTYQEYLAQLITSPSLSHLLDFASTESFYVHAVFMLALDFCLQLSELVHTV